MGCSQLPVGPHTNHARTQRQARKKQQQQQQHKRGKLRKCPQQQQQQGERIGIHNEARLMIILKIHTQRRAASVELN